MGLASRVRSSSTVVGAVVLLASCFDGTIPNGVFVRCAADEDCPAGLVCVAAIAACEPTSAVGLLCGDGVRAGDEECDDGPANDDTKSNACRTACRAARCGDAVVDDGEACDDGPDNSDTRPDACRSTTCALPRCGDGVVDANEGCDDGPGNSDATPNACRQQTCQPASCGDSVVDDGEDCDDGAGLNSDQEPDACRERCVRASCGDNVIDAGEECDDGAANSATEPDACRPTTCALPRCGDSVVDRGEQCDDGNDADGDGCRGDCAKVEVCGDAILDAGEDCDDGNANPVDGCDACRTSTWGFSVLFDGLVEQRGSDVSLHQPPAVAVDTVGRLFVVDAESHRVLRVNSDGIVVVVAGHGTAGFSGDGQPGPLAQLNRPSGIAVDESGRVFIADTGNHRVRRVNIDGTIETIAGTGVAGLTGDGGPAIGAQLNGPLGVAVDGLGRVYIADTGNNRIRRIDVDDDHTIQRIAGDNVAPANVIPRVCGSIVSFLGLTVATDDPLRAQILAPRGVTVGPSGELAIAAAGPPPTLFAPPTSCVYPIGADGLLADVKARLNNGDGGVAIDATGAIYFADSSNDRVVRFGGTPSELTIAGTGVPGFAGDGASATDAQLDHPRGVAVAGDGVLFVADTANQRVRRVALDGTISTVVGNGSSTSDATPSVPGPFSTTRLFDPTALAVLDPSRLVSVGAEGHLLVVDLVQQRVDIGLGSASGASPAGAANAVSLLADARGVAFDAVGGRLLVTENGTNALRVVDVDVDNDGTVDGPASWTTTRVNLEATGPAGVAVDATGTIVVRSSQHCVVRVDDAGRLQGPPILGRCGARGTGPLLDGPTHVAVSSITGAVYVSDTGNNRVVRVLGDDVTTVIGDGSPSSAGEGVPASAFPIDAPRQLALDARGNLFIAGNNVVRVVAHIDDSDDADGNDRVFSIYGRGNRAAFPERESLCIAALALADDGSVFVADQCQGFLVRLTRQTAP
jgi:cysteine-rich repeat protein